MIHTSDDFIMPYTLFGGSKVFRRPIIIDIKCYDLFQVLNEIEIKI